MPDLLETLLPYIQDKLAPEIASRLGVDEALVRQGIAVAVPLLISALARNTASAQGAQSLTNALSSDHDGSVLRDPGGVLEKYGSGEGSAILGHLLGDQRPAIEQAITSNVGIDGSSLLQMLAPALMGALGQAQREQGLDANGVAALVQGEQQQLARQNGDVMQLATQMLDANRDGSPVDEVMGMLGKLLGGKRQ